MQNGKLTFLSLKTALELLESKESDVAIREWIRMNDEGSKGFVDFEDFRRIFVHQNSSNRSNSKQDSRMILLKRAFARYDCDGDGLITSRDLRRAFRSQGKEYSDDEIQDWVSKRDTKGRGGVTYDDFVKHYK